jgi:H+/Cl- antiporter ClcA
VTGFGGLLSSLPVFAPAPEAEGHGTDAVIATLHRRGETIRMWVPLVKLIASAITTGTGGRNLGRLRLAGEPLAPAGCQGPPPCRRAP